MSDSLVHAVLKEHSQWITTPLRGTGLTAPPSPMLRGSFSLDAKPSKAVLAITALGAYEPWLNGQRVGGEELLPGWTDFSTRVAVQTYDVTDQLNEGLNTLGAWLGDGWYSGKIAHFDRGTCYGEHPLLRAAIYASDPTGGWTPLVATDESWQWHAGPITSSDMLDGEHYDARREVPDWSTPVAAERLSPATIDEHGWAKVVVETIDAEPEFVASEAPPVRVTQRLKPVADPVKGQPVGFPRPIWIFDFGQNFTGKVELNVTGPAGCTLRIRHAEALTPAGNNLDTSNLRTCIATDTYTLKGEPGGETWSPRFTVHGFRYISVDYHGHWQDESRSDALQTLTADSVTGLVMHNDMPRTGTFTCGHELLDRLHQNIVWGLRSNFLEAPTDCPQRDERMGWTGDAQVFAPTAAFIYDTTGFYRKWLIDLEDSQAEDGAIPMVAPNVMAKHDSGGAWSDACVLVPWAAYRASGQRAFIDDSYDMMRRWCDYQMNTIVDGIRGDEDNPGFPGFGDWLALDGDPIKPNVNATPRALVGTAYLAHALAKFERMARIAGRDADADEAKQRRGSVRTAFRNRYIDNGSVNVASQTAHLMALSFDLAEDDERAGIFASLLELLAERDHHLCTGFPGTPLWCDTLTREGRVDLAYDLILTETYPGWLYPVTIGATTMWERWNSWDPKEGFVEINMNSLNHYAYGAVGDWMHRTVAGIDLDMAEDVGPALRLSPHPEPRLGRCEATLDSPVGRIESSWTCSEGNASVKLTVPEGIDAVLALPGQAETSLNSGTHEISLEL